MRKIFLYLVLILLGLSMLLPFLAMIMISLSGNPNIFVNISGTEYGFEAYRNVFKAIPAARYFANSLITAVLATVGQVIISALAGYGFARYKFRGSGGLFFLFILTMMVPPQVNIVPLFGLMSALGWVNTYQALIVPAIFGGFGVFLMKQYFESQSAEIEDSSRLDGCNPLETFLYIALPCAAPALATLAVFTFVTNWNSFMWPLIVTNTDNMRTLAVGLSVFKGSLREVTLWGELMACSVVCIIPIIAVYIAGKKYLLNNPLEGSVKED